MKIQSIRFTIHPAFPKGSELEFFRREDVNPPKIFFLIGNNGAGKTNVLETICCGFINNTKTPEEFTASIRFGNGEFTVNRNKNNYSSKLPSMGIPFYYDALETTFTVQKISTVTNQTIDSDKNPKEKSQNLAQLIPQLLVDIKNQDDSFIAEESRRGKLYKDIDPKDLKFTRFTNAFDKIYSGSKRFKDIRNNTEIIFEDANGVEVGIDSLSTGEKQILFRIGGMLKNLSHLDGAIILIDEPETSLHPTWQQKYIPFLLETFQGLDIQFIIATHSLHILQGLKDGESVCIKVDRSKIKVGEQVGYYPNSTGKLSLNLINYLAFDIYDKSLHMELFEEIMIKQRIGYSEMDDYFLRENVKTKSFQASVNVPALRRKIGDTCIETLPVYIRNAIHHPDEIARAYTDSKHGDSNDLKDSIEVMLGLL